MNQILKNPLAEECVREIKISRGSLTKWTLKGYQPLRAVGSQMNAQDSKKKKKNKKKKETEGGGDTCYGKGKRTWQRIHGFRPKLADVIRPTTTVRGFRFREN